MRRVAIYVRTSTSDQHGEAQVYALEKALAAREIQASPDQWFRDIGHTGTTASRPAFQNLRQAVCRGEICTVFVYALDRCSRSLRDLLDFTESLRRTDTGLVVIRENIDLETPVGRMLLGVMGSIAEFEHALTMARVSAGQKRMKEIGMISGRPHRITPEEVNAARKLREQGQSYREIARAIRVPRSTILRALKKEEFAYVPPGNWRKAASLVSVGAKASGS